MNFKDLCNFAFILGVKRGDETLVFPAVDKQQGRTWNYLVICCDKQYNGIWKWKPEIIPHLRVWTNNKKPCYVLPIEECTFIKPLEELDPKLPLGKYLSKIVATIRKEHDYQ